MDFTIRGPPAPCGPVPGGQLYIYQAAACGITRVLSDEAPQLAVHGIFAQAETPSCLPGGSELFASCQLSTGDFAAEDRELLEAVISPKYLDLGQMEWLCQKFEEESQLRLPGFLRSDCLEKISAALREGDSKGGLGNGWQLLGPVLHRRFCAFGKVGKGKKRLASQCPAGKALAQVAKVLASPAFLRYLGRLTAVKAGWQISSKRFKFIWPNICSFHLQDHNFCWVLHSMFYIVLSFSSTSLQTGHLRSGCLHSSFPSWPGLRTSHLHCPSPAGRSAGLRKPPWHGACAAPAPPFPGWCGGLCGARCGGEDGGSCRAVGWGQWSAVCP